MEKTLFNLQLTKDEINTLIKVLTTSIERDNFDGFPAQESEQNLLNYFTSLRESWEKTAIGEQ